MRSAHYGDPITPDEASDGLWFMIDDARQRGGGRPYCCSRGQCATHLAESRPDKRHQSTVHCGSSIAVFPDSEGQILAASGALTQYLIGLNVLGLDFTE